MRREPCTTLSLFGRPWRIRQSAEGGAEGDPIAIAADEITREYQQLGESSELAGAASSSLL